VPPSCCMRLAVLLLTPWWLLAAWWGDDSEWKNANIAADPSDPTKVVVTLPAGVHPASLTAIKYGHQSPKGSPRTCHISSKHLSRPICDCVRGCVCLITN
jgi:hypothetical protein